MKKRWILIWSLMCFGRAMGQVFVFDVSDGLVPDNDSAGLVDVRSVISDGRTIGDISVTLDLKGVGDGGFNGDLYVSLQHETGFSVLLNRVGRRFDSLSGYGDSGFMVTLNDSAILGDIHQYRLTLDGSHQNQQDGPVTGSWAPDSRYADPNEVMDTSPRSAGLNSFHGLDPNGQWILFIADMEAGGQMRLDSWGLIITPVPEPRSIAISFAMGLVFLSFWRMKMKLKCHKSV